MDSTDYDKSFSALALRPNPSTLKSTPLSVDELRKVDAYWRASLYRWLGMLDFKENPLQRSTLRVKQTKSRLLGH